MNRFWRNISISTGIISFVFMFLGDWFWNDIIDYGLGQYYNGVINRSIFYIAVIIAVSLFFVLFENVIWYRKINFNGYKVEIRYGDLLKTHRGYPVINFDECYSTKVGEDTGDIKPSSICGQYLLEYPISDINTLLNAANIKPERKKSEYNKNACYKPGTILKRNNHLLMAFAKLDSKGNAQFFTREDYMNCLDYFWEQLYSIHGDSNVCIPILGTGRTKIGDSQLSRQEVLDLLLFSYLISSYKLQKNYKLVIYCRRKDDIKLFKIFKTKYFIT